MPKIEIINLADLIAAADAAMREEAEQPETLPPGSLFDLEHALAWVTDPNATRPRELRVTAALAREIAWRINEPPPHPPQPDTAESPPLSWAGRLAKKAAAAEAPDLPETPFMNSLRRRADKPAPERDISGLPPLLRVYARKYAAEEAAMADQGTPEPLRLEAALGAGPAGIQVLAADHVVAWTGDIKDAAAPSLWCSKHVVFYHCYGDTAFEEATAWLARYVSAPQ